MIQEASQRALDAGATPVSIFDQARALDVDIPLAVMCYYNTVHHAGHHRFAEQLVAAGICAAIVPDLPLEESGPWCEAADASSVETVMLAAPTAPDDRLPRVCARARGFVYSVGLLGVTGERTTLAATATALASRLKAVTDVPVLVGVGVSNAAQARGGAGGRRCGAGSLGGAPTVGGWRRCGRRVRRRGARSDRHALTASTRARSIERWRSHPRRARHRRPS